MNYIMAPMIKVFYHLKDRLQILQANLSELLQPLFSHKNHQKTIHEFHSGIPGEIEVN